MIRFIAFDCVKDHFLQNEVRRDELPTYISLHISLLCFTASAHHRISNHILATHLPFPRPNHPITPGRASSATTCPLAPLVSRKLQGDVKNTSRQLILRWLLTGSYQIQFSWMLGNISYQRGWIHSKGKKKTYTSLLRNDLGHSDVWYLLLSWVKYLGAVSWEFQHPYPAHHGFGIEKFS